jgi:ribosome biogenesis GTPase
LRRAYDSTLSWVFEKLWTRGSKWNWEFDRMAKKKKVRVDLRKNRSKPPRDQQWTRGFQEHGFADEATKNDERIRAKGELSRRRTIIQDETPAQNKGETPADMPAASAGDCIAGRVLRVHGLISVVAAEDGRQYRCAVRRLLRTLATDERNIVTTGDRVWFLHADPARDAKDAPTADLEGMIERVEPRHGLLTRASRGREHVLVANVDQVVIVVSLVEPDLKPHLIDRYLASAAKGNIQPIISLNKADLVDLAPYQSIVGFYNQLGVPTLLTSATTGVGIEYLRARLKDRQTVFSGQSGVGKSSLLNAIQPELGLRVREVSDVNQKGKHTTTTAELIRLESGGWVVDTPGVRQFELWDVIPEEVEGFFAEFRPFVHLCGFPDCTHTHEERCAIKRAVYRRQISAGRYTSYLGMFHGEAP